jgi:hypothetical protein
MKLLDKLLLALKSAVGGAVEDIVSEATPAADKRDETLRLIEKAQARIDMLRADAERANKRGDAALADRLTKEAGALQQTVDKTRRRIGALKGNEAAVTAIEKAQEEKRAQRDEQRAIEHALVEDEENAAQRADNATARDEVQTDSARIADLLRGDNSGQEPGGEPKQP